MLRYPRRAIIAALALVALGLFLLLLRSNYAINQQPEQQLVRVPADESTPTASKAARLGFDEILVVTAGFHDWRAQGLKAAAERTGLAVTFLQQPSWTDKQKKAFHRGDKYESWSIPGSTGCWLGHLHALKHFLSTKQTTALILEDDADWDVEIKNQVIRAQDFLRKLTEPAADSLWGTEWDVLYLGHCGDRYGPSVLGVHFRRVLRSRSCRDHMLMLLTWRLDSMHIIKSMKTRQRRKFGSRVEQRQPWSHSNAI